MGLSMGYAMEYAMGYAMGYAMSYTMGYAEREWFPIFPESFPDRSVSFACPMFWVSICMQDVLFQRRSSGCGDVAEEGNQTGTIR